jgi:hypothetical protein
MTIDALHGTVDRHESPGGMGAIGTPDANIFLCPSCTRPLAVGVSRCAGCRTRLVRGVPLLKASGFVGLGIVLGLAVGGGLAGGLMIIGRPAAITVEAPPVAVAPSSTAVPSSLSSASSPPQPTAVAADPAIPSAALTALQRSTTVNQRLVADADLLRKSLAGRDVSPGEIAPLLRNLASTAAFGEGIASTVGTWDEADELSTGLAAFYASIARVAEDALAASITNDRAYRDAGRQMLDVLDRLTALDAATRRLASTVDVELPPLTPPQS